MIVVNLERYTDDGFKTSANSLNVSVPDNILAVRFYYNDFLASNYIQATFVDGNTSAVQYDPTTVAFTKFKMFVSTDEVNYTEVVSYGGDEGQDVTNQGLILDPADFSDNELIRKVDSSGAFEPVDLQTLADEISLTIPGGADGTYEIILEIWTANGTTLNSNTLFNNTGLVWSAGTPIDNLLYYTLNPGPSPVVTPYTRVGAVSPLYSFYLNDDAEFTPPEIKGYIMLQAIPVSPPTYSLGVIVSVFDLSFSNGISAMKIGERYIFKINVVLTA